MTQMIFLMCHVFGDLLLAVDPAGLNLHGHKDVIFNISCACLSSAMMLENNYSTYANDDVVT